MGSATSWKWKLVGFIAVLALTVWLVFWLIRPTAQVVAAVRGKALNAVPGSVTVLAERPLELKTEAAGSVVKMNIDISTKVAAKDIVIELDPTDLKLQIEQLESDRATAKRRMEIGSATIYELANAKDTLAVAETHFRNGNFTQADLEKAKRALAQVQQKIELEELTAKQLLDRLENDLKIARRNLDRMTIRTPVSGVVTQLYTREGDLISAGQPVAKIITSTRIVEVKISEENFSGLKVGQNATVRFLSYGAGMYKAKVEKILPDADPQTQRYVLYLTVEIDPKLLVPGITGDASIVVDSRDNAINIPRRALFGRSVFVVTDGRVELRTVEVGFATANQAEILKGVNEGENVIVEDLDRFKQGDRVSVSVYEKKD